MDSSEIRKDKGLGGRRLVTVGFLFTVTTLMGLICSPVAIGVYF